MALKPSRLVVAEDVSYFCNEVAEEGGPMCLSTGGSGAALDSSNAVVFADHTPSGSLVVGVLLDEVVNIDQTRQKINFHQHEVQLGGKVALMTQGWVDTNKITSGVTPAGGDRAFADSGSNFSNVATAGPFCGHFMSSKDEDGYAKVYVNLPSKEGYQL